MVKRPYGPQFRMKETGSKHRIEPSQISPNTGQAYYYNLQPPPISWTTAIRTTLKEWGEPASFDEEYSLDELEDFQCGIATVPISDDPTISSPTSNMGMKRGLDLLDYEGGPTVPSPSPKRLRSGETSLYHLIPKPHTHPSPFVPCPIDMRHLPKYWKAQPSYISPYDSEQLSCLPDTSRLSWIIPVCGKLPWAGSTPASISFDTQPSSSADDGDSRQTILWTADSLLQFWDLLLTFQKGGGCGSFGLSFHFARKRNACKPKRTKGLTLRLPQAPAGKDSPPSLATIDFIKVYHDAFARLQLRALFDIFPYKVNDKGHTRETKILEGARLVLLDNTGRAVLIL
ncbi:hypothetical protein BJ165DRAFT_43263 [Panaeolus papilionaceus]|nr:hypothetical protein BJ165DRAFT_43263 [Panaeolus papilionaceus]